MRNINSLSTLIIISSLLTTCTINKGNLDNNSQPNVLWITCEDISIMQGSYGDEIALTPNLDKLASEGIQYMNAFATAAVCSPARSCLVTGVYATSLGTQNLRSEFRIPEEIKTLPHILREHGYYCTNNYKEDYNFTDSTIWDESSKTAHWRNRPKNQPFYSVFNLETTHQSQIFGDDESFYNKYGKLLSDEQRHKPEDIILAPYFFDSPVVRKLWARYYDLVSIMDRQVADILVELEKDGLKENTIVFYFSDHGTGMPRAKRALYNSGVQVPFIISAPEKYQEALGTEPGTRNDQIVSFIDFPPTVLALAGIDIPLYMQGQSFMGESSNSTNSFSFATSDRVDEAYEISRTVKNGRFSYIRNFLPHQPLIKPNYYSDKSEIMKELYRIKAEVALADMTAAQQSMWQPRRTPEELYDLANDPFELNNLAADLAHKQTLHSMRNALKDWMISTHDTGLIPEGYLLDQVGKETVYEIAQQKDVFPIDEILALNDLILSKPIDQEGLTVELSNPHELVRYWATVSLQYLEHPSPSTIANLKSALLDTSQLVQLATAETLCAFGICNIEAQQNIVAGLKSENEANMLYASRIYELHKDKVGKIEHEVMEFYEKICAQSTGKWKGYDLYACWALTEAFKPPQ